MLLQSTLIITTVFVTKDFAAKKKVDLNPFKARIRDTFESFFYKSSFCVFVRIASSIIKKGSLYHLFYLFALNSYL